MSDLRAARGALLICAVTLPLVSGCALYNRVFHRGAKESASCHERPFRGNTDTHPPLKVPEGLSAPDTRNAVKVPELNGSGHERSSNEPCLALPPKFSVKPPAPAVKSAAPASSAPAPAPPAAPSPAAPPPAAPAPAPSGNVVPQGS